MIQALTKTRKSESPGRTAKAWARFVSGAASGDVISGYRAENEAATVEKAHHATVERQDGRGLIHDGHQHMVEIERGGNLLRDLQ